MKIRLPSKETGEPLNLFLGQSDLFLRQPDSFLRQSDRLLGQSGFLVLLADLYFPVPDFLDGSPVFLFR
jgi:hypothetical protein